MCRSIRSVLLLATALTAFVGSARSQNTTTVGFDSGSQLVYSNPGKTLLLTAGTLSVTGDGAVLQLGYYTNATVGNYFSGTFVPLSGKGSTNTAFSYTSIGDLNSNGAGNGQFALSLTFTVGNATTGNNLPATGVPLVLRFYDATATNTPTKYNDVSDSLWLWQAPTLAGSNVAISLNDVGLTWLGGASTAFYTSQPVPEPSTVALLGSSLLIGVICLRRRMRRA